MRNPLFDTKKRKSEVQFLENRPAVAVQIAIGFAILFK